MGNNFPEVVCSILPLRFVRVTGTSPQNSQMIWRRAPQGGVSASLIPAVVRYIQTQESHHRKMTFDVEWTALLKKHGAEFDPKFVFG